MICFRQRLQVILDFEFRVLSQGPGQICLDFHTFVCMTCSGVHREFQHKCKGISMSKWTPEEVKAIEASGGNPHDSEVWLARWDASLFPRPAPNSLERIRKFIQMKYIERRWYSASSTPDATASSSVAHVPPPAHSQPSVPVCS